ncbi:hypothetical protein [Paenibacillus sp. FSL E2-0178]|uniref:hypothetical protein n=1 Tax=Paenibacillus sp. FSL E2-0178 TaxID=2921361 RepID=UPI003157FD8E
MQLYQFWWYGAYEGETGEPLAHEKVFSREDLAGFIKESNYMSSIEKLEKFLIEEKGFYKPNCIRVDADDPLKD